MGSQISQQTENIEDVRSRKGRKIQDKIQVSLQQSRTPVSCGQNPQTTEERKLRTKSRSWSSCLHGSCYGVSCCRDTGACRQCCQGQQEEQDHTQAPPAGH